MQGILAGSWRLGSDIATNRNKSLINNNNTKVSENLIQNINERNSCRENPLTNNPVYSTTDKGAKQKYIKVDTPWKNKVKTTQVPQVILPYGSLVQSTYRAELNFSSSLSTRAKTSRTPPQPPIRGTDLHRETMKW